MLGLEGVWKVVVHLHIQLFGIHYSDSSRLSYVHSKILVWIKFKRGTTLLKYNEVTFIYNLLTPVSYFTIIYCKFATIILRVEKDFTIPPANTVICRCVALNGLKTTVVTKGKTCLLSSVKQTEIPAYKSSNQFYPIGCCIEESSEEPKSIKKGFTKYT